LERLPLWAAFLLSTTSKKDKNMNDNKVEIGANFGELLSQVEVTTEQQAQVAETPAAAVEQQAVAPVAVKQPRLMVRPSKPVIPTRKVELRIVGLCIEPEAPGLMTADAEGVCNGYIIYGPNPSLSGLIPFERFVGKLQMDKITLRQRFHYNRENGKVYRGAIMHDIEGKHTCGFCQRSHFNLSFSKLNDLRREQGVQQGPPYCQICLDKLTEEVKQGAKYSAGEYEARKAKTRLRWRAADAVRIGAGDMKARQLYAEYMKYIDTPHGETVDMLPRIWAVYPVNSTPGDWVPEDPIAQQIDAAEQTQGLTIRPFSMVNRDNAGALLALRMEATRGVDGKPGMAVGWLSTETLVTTHTRGYTMQMVPNYRLASPEHFRRGPHHRHSRDSVGKA
jgi:hypothetical protein